MSIRVMSAAATLALLAAGGCTAGGSSGAGPATPAAPSTTNLSSSPGVPTRQVVACPVTARAAAVRAAGHGGRAEAAAVRTRDVTLCTYRMTVSSGHLACDRASVRVFTGAQAITDFNRWVDEQAQNADANGPGSAPQQLSARALGPAVEWVPAQQTLQLGVSGRWVTIAVHCSRTAAALSLARRLAATAVHRHAPQ